MTQQPEFTPRRGSVSSHYEAPQERGHATRSKEAEPVFFAVTYGVVVLAWLFVAAILALVVLGVAAQVWLGGVGN
jgi:hypothetical protein